MDHINLFQTNAEFLSAYNGSDYVEPWLSYTMETSGLSFNKGTTPPPSPYLSIPLTIEVTAGSGEITLNRSNIKYKLNDGDWTQDSHATISVSNGDTIQLKEDLEEAYASGEYLPLFVESDASSNFRYMIYGNIMSVYQEIGFENLTEFTNEEAYTFANLFRDCCYLTSAENLALPVTALTYYCYQGMFRGCSLLTAVPSLPATTLAEACYGFMFQDCTSLTTAPELPATTLANWCYDQMFFGCTSLTGVPSNYLPVTTLAPCCYFGMFQGCISLTAAPVLPATTLASGCYEQMFTGCTSLTLAPELPATTLAQSCYWTMFQGCTNLNYIKCLATDMSANQCTYNWIQGVQTNSGTFIKSSAADWSPKTGNDGIPSNWAIEDAS